MADVHSLHGLYILYSKWSGVDVVFSAIPEKLDMILFVRISRDRTHSAFAVDIPFISNTPMKSVSITPLS